MRRDHDLFRVTKTRIVNAGFELRIPSLVFGYSDVDGHEGIVASTKSPRIPEWLHHELQRSAKTHQAW